MHCLPGMVSEEKEPTRSQRIAFKVGLVSNVPERTTFTGGASNQLEELLSSFQVLPLQIKTGGLSEQDIFCQPSHLRHSPIPCPDPAQRSPPPARCTPEEKHCLIIGVWQAHTWKPERLH